MSLKNWAMFWYMGVVWGATFLWLKIAIRETEPITLNAIRLFVAMIALFIIVKLSKARVPFRERWRSFLFLGIFNIALPFVLITWSEHFISTGMASILNSTVPFFTIILVPFFVPDETWSLQKIFGLAVGFVGVVVLVANKTNGTSSGFQWGSIMVLIAALSYAVAAVFARRVTAGLHPAAQAFGQSVFANLALWSLAFILEGPFTLPRLPLTWGAILWLGIMATAVGTFFYYSLLNQIGATRTSLTTYIFPLVGVLLGVIFLDEQMSWRLLTGGLLIIAGVAIVNSKKTGLVKPEKVQQW
ncbi:MAG: DMT family transporter [Bellilinea sp.]